ncbi:oligosaccharide flippase family protein [Mycoavidus sp. SF9855]|uniref:oligosaccharide flippase family protein n=1 Tax=Mycoavidus sp. SF9855 TaxID=2968475 RepID=UPI0034D16FCC
MSELSMGRALAWSAAATLIKMGLGLLVVKWMAHAFGPDGMGRAGNFIALVTLLGVLSGAGIYNGVTKYVAEFQHDPVRLRRLLGTSSIIVFGFSCVLALLFILAAAPLSQLLFGREDLQSVVWAIAFIQFGIAYANLFLAILKGQCDARGNALSVIAGSLLGLGVCWLAFRLGDYSSALIGLALAPALLVLPAGVMLFKRGIVSLKPRWDSTLARGLCKFTAMAHYAAAGLRHDERALGSSSWLGRSWPVAGSESDLHGLFAIYHGAFYRIFAAHAG